MKPAKPASGQWGQETSKTMLATAMETCDQIGHWGMEFHGKQCSYPVSTLHQATSLVSWQVGLKTHLVGS
jgi:hypothetical protein